MKWRLLAKFFAILRMRYVLFNSEKCRECRHCMSVPKWFTLCCSLARSFRHCQSGYWFTVQI